MPPESGSSETVDQGKVVAVDLNGTLASGRGLDPSSWGEPTEGAVDAMRSLKERGYLVCINSVVGDKEAIKGWLAEHGIPFDHVNESPAQPDGSSDKLNAAAYLDDRAIPFRGDWKATLEDLFASGVMTKRIVAGIHKSNKGQYVQDEDDVIGPFDTQEEAVKKQRMNLFDAEPLLQTGVYLIINALDGKRYIGSTAKSFKARWYRHRLDLSRNRHGNKHLQRAWNRDGKDAFKFVVLERCPPQECVGVERKWIGKCSAEGELYNHYEAANSPLGMKHSEETRKKMSAKAKARHHPYPSHLYTPEVIAKAAESRRGQKQSPEWIEARVSKARGKKRPPEAVAATAAFWRGHKHSAESKERMRVSALNRSPESKANVVAGAAKRVANLTAEKRAAMAARATGKKYAAGKRSAESRAAMSEAQKLYYREHPEAIEKQRQRMIGKKYAAGKRSDESKARMSAARLAWLEKNKAND